MKKWALLLVALMMAPFSEGVQIPSFGAINQAVSRPTTRWSGGQWFLAHQPSTAVALWQVTPIRKVFGKTKIDFDVKGVMGFAINGSQDPRFGGFVGKTIPFLFNLNFTYGLAGTFAQGDHFRLSLVAGWTTPLK